MKHLIIKITIVIFLSLGIVGCGGGGGSSSNTEALEGVFADAPVMGLKYVSKTYSGITDSAGVFKYKAGENVTFKIGNLTLGTVVAKDIITPIDLGGGDLNNPTIKAKNIAMLLQNFNTDRFNQNYIRISSDINISNSDINLSDSVLESKMNNILNKFSNYIDKNDQSVIGLDTAFNNMKNFIKYYRFSATIIGQSILDESKSDQECLTEDSFTAVTNGKVIVGKFLNNGYVTGNVDEENGNIYGTTTNYITFSGHINSNGDITGKFYYGYNGINCYYTFSGFKAKLKITLLKDLDLYKGGTKIFTAKKGDILKIILAKNCLYPSQDKVCLKVEDVNLSKIGYINAETIYKNHLVEKK